MVTPVKGDRESKQSFIRHALDEAFSDRISAIFNTLCVDFESETAVRLFTDKFKIATDQWNAATAAISEEYAPPAP
jgi:hypothetical protein